MNGIPARFEPIIAATRAGELPPRIAYMQLAMLAESAEELASVLCAASPGASGPLRSVAALADAHPDGWQTVRAILAVVQHDRPESGDPQARLNETAAMFDRAIAISPEASVALFSLGDPEALSEVTDEVAAWLKARGVAGPDVRLLDFGCGIGRLELALVGEVGSITGVDISAAMVAEARRRCAALANVAIQQISGCDLAGLVADSFDAVVALDSFPYLVSASGDLPGALMHEAARVLSPGGHLLILNYSYRGDPARDCADAERLGAAAGLVPVMLGERPFRLWDGLAFHLVKRGS